MLQSKIVSALGALGALALGAGTGAKDAPCVWLLDDLIGMQVLSEQGDNLGQIEDVIVHVGGDASYAVLSLGAWSGASEKRLAMPWRVLRTVEAGKARQDSARTFVLLLDQGRLRSAPAFDEASWPTLANTDWAKAVDAYYAGDGGAPSATELRLPPITWRATKLRGVELATPKGDRLGGLEQIAIDTNGRVSFATVAVGPMGGFGLTVSAVPWDALTFTLGGGADEQKLVTLDRTQAQLELAPQRPANRRAGTELCEPKWLARLYEYFACPPYWTSTGERVPLPASGR